MLSFFLQIHSTLIFLAVVAGPWIAALVFESICRTRRRRLATILIHFNQAIRCDLPLPAMLKAAARSDEDRIVRRYLAQLAECLQKGALLSTAMRESIRSVPQRVVGLISTAERTGSLKSTINYLADGLNQSIQSRRKSFAGIYITLLLFMTTAHFVVVMFRINPELQQYAYLSTDILGVSQYTWSILVYSVITVVVLAYLLVVTSASDQISALLLRFAHAFDLILYRIPVVGAIQRDRGLTDVCHVAAGALEAGISLNRAIAEAEHVGINRALRSQLRCWIVRLEAGDSPAEAARKAHLPSLVVGMVRSGTAAGNLAQVFDFMGHYFSAKFSRAVTTLRAALGPTLVILIGILTAIVAYQLMLPFLDAKLWELKEMGVGS